MNFTKAKKIIAIILLVIIVITICVLSYPRLKSHILSSYFEKSILTFAEKNNNTIFKIDKIALFSSADTENKNAYLSNFTVENLYQFTDIALFIDNKVSYDSNNLQNTLKSVTINNIQYQTSPSLGTPNLYYKNINNFATSSISYDNLITDELKFSISSDDETNLDYPTLYNNCANPIVLSYVNNNIKNDYTFTDTSLPITYDGSLLKKCNISLSSIECSFSFDINITNNLDETYKTTIFIHIPLEDETNSIYNGKYIQKKDVNYIFYKYE